ncbi:hypothetical protein DERP_013272 [Dermatophagoides pteronyssinus]|uniref:Uncharacterized protein n=1 Tax=Dermatophagoides pteronyssinus TaxID=6956 RepID=A0ABQ8J3F8_DERPT|nr:hypothetical protein DERP_013272 [Dermatophagoides pteronyssinus]
MNESKQQQTQVWRAPPKTLPGGQASVSFTKFTFYIHPIGVEKGFAGAGYILSLLIVSFANGQTSSVTYLWITFIVSTEETNDKIDRFIVIRGVFCRPRIMIQEQSMRPNKAAKLRNGDAIIQTKR